MRFNNKCLYGRVSLYVCITPLPMSIKGLAVPLSRGRREAKVTRFINMRSGQWAMIIRHVKRTDRKWIWHRRCHLPSPGWRRPLRSAWVRDGAARHCGAGSMTPSHHPSESPSVWNLWWNTKVSNVSRKTTFGYWRRIKDKDKMKPQDKWQFKCIGIPITL